MLEFFNGRRLRYQIFVLRDDRWQLVKVVDDGRDSLLRRFDRIDLEALETQVRTIAKSEAHQPGVTAVKVVRERRRDDGYVGEELLFRLDVPKAEARAAISGFSGSVPLCTTLDDLFQRPAIRVIGSIMRPWLDKNGVTAIDLLTHELLSRRCEQAETLFYTGLQKAGRQQAEETKQNAKLRIAELDRLLSGLKQKLRAAKETTKPVVLGGAGLQAFLDEIARRHPDADRRFWGLRGLSLYLGGGGYGSQLERLLPMLHEDLGPDATDIVDESIACLFDSNELVREVLGEQPNLRAALLAIAGLARGEFPAISAPPKLAAALALSLQGDRLPKLQSALWDRIVRSLDGLTRLTHDGPDGEWDALQKLERELPERIGEGWREPTVARIKARMNRLRLEMLEQL